MPDTVVPPGSGAALAASEAIKSEPVEAEPTQQERLAKLLARRFTVNPVLVMIGVFFWYWMWGVVGAILATPLLAITKIICDRIEPLQPVGHFIGR